jgi:hypothetical protein
MNLGLLDGVAAGAAGTTALNAATYVDMAVRGRPASETPQQLVNAVAGKAGVDVPGRGQERDNRLSGLGPLAGDAVGVAVGAVAGVLHRALRARGRRLPAALSILLIGGAAMALSDVPLKALGISDPKAWAATDWAADVVPHLVYGAVTYATLRATEAR